MVVRLNSLALFLSLHTELMFAVHQLKAKHHCWASLSFYWHCRSEYISEQTRHKSWALYFSSSATHQFCPWTFEGGVSLLQSVSLFSQNKHYWLWIHSDLTQSLIKQWHLTALFSGRMQKHQFVKIHALSVPGSHWRLQLATLVFLSSQYLVKKKTKKQNNGHIFIWSRE